MPRLHPIKHRYYNVSRAAPTNPCQGALSCARAACGPRRFFVTARRSLQRRRSMKLKDKVAVITGAGNGQGKAAALLFAAEGAAVVAADIDETAARGTAQEITS